MYIYGHFNPTTKQYNYALLSTLGKYAYAEPIVPLDVTYTYTQSTNGSYVWQTAGYTFIGEGVPVGVTCQDGHATGAGASPSANLYTTVTIPKVVGATGYYSFNWAFYASAAISGTFSTQRSWKASVKDARFYPSTRRFTCSLYWHDPDIMTNYLIFPVDIILPDTNGYHQIYNSEFGFSSGDYNYARVHIAVDHKTDASNLLIQFAAEAYGEENDYAEVWMDFWPGNVAIPHPEAFKAQFIYQ